MAPALVFAATSFVGRHLVKRLQQTGRPVVATGRQPQPGQFVCDLTQPGQVECILVHHRPAWIFQSAGATAGGTRADMDRLHVDATRILLQTCARLVPQARIVLFGSAAEYGNVEPRFLPVTEKHPPLPTSDFGLSKLAQFQVATEMARTHGLQVAVVRPFNILGPGLPAHYFAGRLCQRLLTAQQRGESGPMPIANAQATRDWIDVRDVAEAVVRLAQDFAWLPGQVEAFNLATGREASVLEVAQRLCALGGPFQAVPEGTIDSRSAIMRSCGDASKIEQAIGWRAAISWEESVAAQWAAACGLAKQ